MAMDRRTHPDRMDTRLAKQAERAKSAEEVWAEVNEQQRQRDDKTERLKAARLTQEAKHLPTTE